MLRFLQTGLDVGDGAIDAVAKARQRRRHAVRSAESAARRGAPGDKQPDAVPPRLAGERSIGWRRSNRSAARREVDDEGLGVLADAVERRGHRRAAPKKNAPEMR